MGKTRVSKKDKIIEQILEHVEDANTEELAKSTTAELEKMLSELEKDTDAIGDELGENTEAIHISEQGSPEPQEVEYVSDNIPKPSDYEWTEYALSFLRDEEQFNGYPRVDGLRRLVELLVLPVCSVNTEVVSPPCEDNHFTTTARVIVTLTDGSYFCGTADAGGRNTDFPFSVHPSAVAETKAEGRAYKKALRLSSINSAEEMIPVPKNNNENNPPNTREDRINRQQMTMLRARCIKGGNGLDVNLQKLVKEVTNKNKVSSMSGSEAREVASKLNEFMKNGVPEELKGYDPNWK
jgi:hypothetical protein